MQTLRAFYNYFKAQADNTVGACWTYNTYETKLGYREEIVFVSSSIVLQMMPPNQDLSLIVIQTKDTRIYKHAAYLMGLACSFFLDADTDQYNISTYGQGFQGFIGVNSVDIKAFNIEGTVERLDRFGNQHEHSITKVAGVTVKRLPKEMK
jgi:hypothetical protein